MHEGYGRGILKIPVGRKKKKRRAPKEWLAFLIFFYREVAGKGKVTLHELLLKQRGLINWMY